MTYEKPPETGNYLTPDAAIRPDAGDKNVQAVFTTGSTLHHVIKMTSAGAVGLVSIFIVELLNLFYISLLGETELTAAVGYASTIFFFTISFSIGFSIASTAIISRGLGAGDGEDVKSAAGAVLIFIAVINTITALIFYPLIGPALTMLGAAGNTHAVALDFVQIVLPFFPLMGVGMCASGLLRAKGDARRAMWVTLNVGIAAAIMDPLLIFYFDLGVRGAAISTALTRVVMVATGLYGLFLVHDMVAMPSRKQLVALTRPYFHIAIPALLTQIATPFSNAYMTASVSQFGDAAVTGWTVIGRLVPFAFVGLFTLSAAVGPILGQNLGAKLYERIISTMWNSLFFALIYTMIVWAILAIFSNQITELFQLSGDAAQLVKFFCLIIGGTYVFQGGLFVANAAFNNLGYPFYSTFFNWGRATVGTIPFVYFGAQWGAEGALAGYGIGGILFGVGAVWMCFRKIKQLKQRDSLNI